MLVALKDSVMRITQYSVLWSALLLTACAMTQNPAVVSDTHVAPVPVAEVNKPVAIQPLAPVKQTNTLVQQPPKEVLRLSALTDIAKAIQKNPQAAKKYVGVTLSGQAKFIKAPKANPNTVVADVRVTGLGEVSLWCRNVLGAAPAGRVMTFEGTLSGSVYTSEDFSHDVTMKDCRFHE